MPVGFLFFRGSHGVWGGGEELMLSDTVDVHISYLRKKIDREAKVKLIKTVKGAGYKIEA